MTARDAALLLLLITFVLVKESVGKYHRQCASKIILALSGPAHGILL